MDKRFAWVYCFSLYLLIDAIYDSKRRWLSLGYAILAFAVTIVAGILLTFLLGPGSIDTIGTGLNYSCPFAAVFGAHIPPRRKP